MAISELESRWLSDAAPDMRPITVGDSLRDAFAREPHRQAVMEAVDGEVTASWTYEELLRDAERAARSLATRFTPGDRVAIWAPNSGRWVVLQQALALAGVVAVPLNPAYRESEVIYALTQSGSRGLLHASSHRGFDMSQMVAKVRSQCPELSEVICLDDWDSFMEGGDQESELPQLSGHDPLVILYTSGTTGKPKGALLHHMGLVHQARLATQRVEFTAEGVWINPLPLYHMAGGGLVSTGVIAHGGTHVVMPNFDAGEALGLLEKFRGTHTLLVPTMLRSVLEHPDLHERDLTSVHCVLSGASVVPPDVVRRTTEAFDCRFSILYGLAETGGVVTQTTFEDSVEDQSFTIGRPLTGIEFKVIDPETGVTTRLDEPGELVCRTPQLMLGYYEMPEATAATIDSEGWLHTGDLGAMDGRGFVRITGRLKDTIIRGGLNIYPREIEDVLISHPSVLELAVLGVPDDKWGEEIAAVLRTADDVLPPSAHDLRAYCVERLARHKAPVQWYSIEEFPMTPTGKIQKFLLADMIARGTLQPLVEHDSSHV
ncbi:MAG: AMP-binding protein [Nocardioides sp.]|uniref:class I adenylate-forming enzyme family protein n=1 Tax=Nocardioides sp. TaxID=35761 RepID=UPI0032649746